MRRSVVSAVAAGRGSLPGRLVAAGGPLHQPDFLDVARQRRLGDVDAPLEQALAERLLVGDRLSPDELEDGGLPLGFHAGTRHHYTWPCQGRARSPEYQTSLAKSATFLLTGR